MKKFLLLVWLLTTTPLYALTNLPVFQNGVKPDVIFKMPDAIRTECLQTGSPEGYLNCMLTYMQKHHAGPQAIAIMQLTRGVVTDDKTYGPVTVLHLAVPGADHSDAFYIVSNTGDIFDIDDSAILSQIDITKDPLYSTLLQQYPNISVWPGNHQYPVATTLPGNIQQLVFTYSLLNGCHACELAGIAKIAFNFDNTGQLLNTQFLGLAASPVGQASS